MSIAAGDQHSCALLDDSSAKCWGFGGKTGDGTNVRQLSPVDVLDLSTIESLKAKGFGYSCALLTSDVVTCWGSNSHGELGDGTNSSKNAPTSTVDVENVASIAVGDSHSCAVLLDGTAKCWGRNDDMQLGNGDIFNSSSPVFVLE